MKTSRDVVIKTIWDAVYGNDAIKTREMLQSNPDLINYYDGQSWLNAAAGRSLELVRVLIELGCDIDCQTQFGETALSTAIGRANLPIVQFLVEKGANTRKREEKCRYVIAAVSAPRHEIEMLRLLESTGVDLNRVFLNEQTGKLMTALSRAMDLGKTPVVSYLQSRGALLPSSVDEPKCEVQANEICAFFSQQFGKVGPQSLNQIVPDLPFSLKIHVIPPNKATKCITIFTSGMSDVPMEDVNKEFQYAELYLQLPSFWDYRVLDDIEWYWPVYWLMTIARMPFDESRSFGGPLSIIENGSPPERFTPEVEFNSWLLIADKNLVTGDGRKIYFYRMVPLFPEEHQLQQRKGIQSLLQALDKFDIPFVIDLSRTNVATTTKRQP